MRDINTNKQILNYIKENYDYESPIFLNEVYKSLPSINGNTIRSTFKRLFDKGRIIKIKNGIYALSNQEDSTTKPIVYASKIIEEKYIFDSNGDRVGYKTGINFSNELGLTSQIASVETIYSNNVSNKKRMIKVKNNRIIINSPRVKVTNNNYKLLQVLDLLNDFDRYSEIELNKASARIMKVLKTVNLDQNEIEKVVSVYPLKAQVNFYKLGGINVAS